MMPPCAFSLGTANSTVGVVDNPKLIMSIPRDCSVPMHKLSTIFPDSLASLPMTTVRASFLCFFLSQRP